MLNTNIIAKTGRDFVNLFYNIPEDLRMNKTEGKAVGSLRFEISVDGLQFFSKEITFHGANSSEPFGRITIPQLGEGRYSYKITETLVAIKKEQYGKNTVCKNHIDGSFIIDESSPHVSTGFGAAPRAVLGY